MAGETIKQGIVEEEEVLEHQSNPTDRNVVWTREGWIDLDSSDKAPIHHKAEAEHQINDLLLRVKGKLATLTDTNSEAETFLEILSLYRKTTEDWHNHRVSLVSHLDQLYLVAAMLDDLVEGNDGYVVARKNLSLFESIKEGLEGNH